MIQKYLNSINEGIIHPSRRRIIAVYCLGIALMLTYIPSRHTPAHLWIVGMID